MDFIALQQRTEMASVEQDIAEIRIARKVYDESAPLLGTAQSTTNESPTGRRSRVQAIKTKLTSCSCSRDRVYQFFIGLFPIIKWLPKYNIKNDLVADISGGLTVGIMHIPQGLAFAMLASLPPVTGLYTALIPVLVYMLMGTSRHLSVGSFAVICLMVANVCEREVAKMSFDDPSTPAPGNMSSTLSPTTSSSRWSPIDTVKLEIAVSLACLIGIFQIIMGAIRLGVLATFMSDPMISGFTTGSAVLVVISQLPHIFGLKVPPMSSPLTAPKKVIYMLKHIGSSNGGAIITGVLCLLILIGLRQVNDRFKSKLPVPIPGELLVVVIGTAISYGAKINQHFGVSILGEIPKGLPPISVPSFSWMSKMIPDAFVIAVVIFATNISVSKMFAKKRGYTIDPNQELIAYGVGNVAGSFSSCFAICNALARTAVQENLANTQLCSIVVIVLILLVLLFLAPLFFYLPKAILAAVVIANLIGLLKQFTRLKALWYIYRPDAVVWFLTCFGVILMGVDLGLGIGVICTLFAVVLTLYRSNYFILGHLRETELYRDVEQCSLALEVPGIKVMRFESSLYFGNVERFRKALVAITGHDPTIKEEKKSSEAKSNNGELVESNKTAKGRQVKGSNHEATAVSVDDPDEVVRVIVIDGSSFTFIDSMGLQTLPAVIKDYKKFGVQIYLAGCSSYIKTRLVNSKEAIGGIDPHLMFPSIHDAVVAAANSS
ncbi:Solute carrier family 26 member 6 [Acropora cervicornis]|uniref:Solute carrier family 26 member 6 n=1 Tax=Acropora cervicornis TaxID=6130 RepID=A0AAD9VGI5_ACRCE|nr:Solute carrier family 26 member 6 [Acropora cervicornis]